MTDLDIHDAMHALAADRPVFHSEADFQHALAWRLQRSDGQRSLRLETRAPLDETLYIDVVATDADGTRTAIELKYWTKRLEVDLDGEPFRLRNQGAHDISRYDLVKDITRVERLVRAGVADSGWVVALTNDHNYWSPATRVDTIDAAFRLSEGRVLPDALPGPTTPAPAPPAPVSGRTNSTGPTSCSGVITATSPTRVPAGSGTWPSTWRRSNESSLGLSGRSQTPISPLT